MNVITAICAGCLTRVDAGELENEDHKCDVCRQHKARTGLDNDGQPLGADAGVHVEDLAGAGNSLLDLREFDGGETLHACDEV